MYMYPYVHICLCVFMCVSMYRCVYIPPHTHACACTDRQTDFSVYCLQLWDTEGASLIPQPPTPCLFANFVGEPLWTVVCLCLCVCPLCAV